MRRGLVTGGVRVGETWIRGAVDGFKVSYGVNFPGAGAPVSKPTFPPNAPEVSRNVHLTLLDK